jgi:long-subunit acyl-CoA synthetase (AMP-forming)
MGLTETVAPAFSNPYDAEKRKVGSVGKNEAATAGAFFPDGWFRSGDIAPREIDEVLLRHPAVLDAAAVGIPDKHYG